MNLVRYLIIVCSFLGAGFCSTMFNRDKVDTECTKPRDQLVVTWAAPNDTSNPLAFTHMPRTVKDAEAKNWTLLDDGCKNTSLKHKGKRYILGNDVSVLLIFDKNGYIAGMQTSLDRAIADNGTVVDYKTLGYFYPETIKGKDRYMQTFYVIDPEKVCSGRTKAQFTADGTVKKLYYQIGPKTFFSPPLTEDNKTLTDQHWVKGLCVKGMGMHYYQYATPNVNCSMMKPFFLMYDCGRLIGMGMFVLGVFQEPRFESVPEEILKIFIHPVPYCLNDAYKRIGSITSMHVFFVDKPLEITCPKGTTLEDL